MACLLQSISRRQQHAATQLHELIHLLMGDIHGTVEQSVGDVDVHVCIVHGDFTLGAGTEDVPGQVGGVDVFLVGQSDDHAAELGVLQPELVGKLEARLGDLLVKRIRCRVHVCLPRIRSAQHSTISRSG